MNHLISSVMLFLVVFSNSSADEFTSLEKLRIKYHASYGPSLKEALPFDPDGELKIAQCVVYFTETVIDADYAFSSMSIAGRKFSKRVDNVSNENANSLLSCVKDYNNYGDIMIGVFHPNIAIEFVCGENTFVLNYEEKLKFFNLSSPRCKEGEIRLKHWSRPVRASEKLIAAIQACIQLEKKEAPEPKK